MRLWRCGRDESLRSLTIQSLTHRISYHLFMDREAVSVGGSAEILHEEIYYRTVVPFTLFTSSRRQRKAT